MSTSVFGTTIEPEVLIEYRGALLKERLNPAALEDFGLSSCAAAWAPSVTALESQTGVLVGVATPFLKGERNGLAKALAAASIRLFLLAIGVDIFGLNFGVMVLLEGE